MLKSLPQSVRLEPHSLSVEDAVSYINEYIDRNSCSNIKVDISTMNILDACYVSTLCSTKHYIKYPDGKIEWKISSEMVKEFNKDFELGNISYEF